MKEVKDSGGKAGRQLSAFSFFKAAGAVDVLKKDPVTREICALAVERGIDAYLVGGMLRNIVLEGSPGRDRDLCVDGDVKGFAEGLAGRLGGSFFLMDEESRTYRVVVKDGVKHTIDVSPVKEGDIVMDLEKRDFTVNALAVPAADILHGERVRVIDPCGGLDDARRRVLKVVAQGAFDDDPLRLLRAVRLSQQCRLSMEEATSDLVRDKAHLIAEAARERVRDELLLIFSCAGSAQAIESLYELGMVGYILPEIKGWRDVQGYDLLSHSLKTLGEAERILTDPVVSEYPLLGYHLESEVAGVKRYAVFKLAAFLHDIGKPATMKTSDGELSFMGHDVKGEELVKVILRRLRFGRKVIRLVATIVRNHHRVFTLASIDDPSRRAKSHFFNAVGGDTGLDLLCLGLADARATRGGEDPGLRERVGQMLEFYFDVYTRKPPKPLMGGHEIMETFGVPQGVMVGEIMRKIARGIEDGAVRNRKDAVRYVKKWLADREEGGK